MTTLDDGAGRLGPPSARPRWRRWPATTFDVVVVGGGVVGAGAALDAATRGLSVGLVEARDWAARHVAAGPPSSSTAACATWRCSTSGWSRRRCSERGLMRHAAGAAPGPAGAVPLPAQAPRSGSGPTSPPVSPSTTHGPRRRARPGLPLPQAPHPRAGPARRAGSAKDALVGAVRYYDAQVDDARHTMTIVRTAAALRRRRRQPGPGRRLPARGGAGGRRPRCATTRAAPSSRSRPSRSSTPPASGPTRRRRMVGERGQLKVRASKGIHLVVPRDRIQSTVGLILRTEKSVLFVIPWGRHWIIGTTDTDWQLDKAHPAASSRGHRLPARARQRRARDAADPRGRRGRLRRAAPAAGRRERADVEAVPGARRGAPRAGARRRGRRQVHDVPGDGQGRRGRGRPRRWTSGCRRRAPTRCRCWAPRATSAAWNRRQRTAARSGLHVARIEHLLGRYGSMSERGPGAVRERPELAEPLPGAEDYLPPRSSTPPPTRGPGTWTTC